MIGINSGGGADASGVFLTNLDEIGSLDHSSMHKTNNVHSTIKRKKKITNKKKGKNNFQS